MRSSVVPLVLALSLAACGSPKPVESPDDAHQESFAETQPSDTQPSKAAPLPMTPDPAQGEETPADEDATAPPATVPPSAPPDGTIAETRTTEVIQNVVLQNRHSVRRCYDLERQKDPSLRGTLTIHFKLDPKGNVALAQVNTERSTLTHPQLVRCALDAIKKLKFPPSSRGFESAVNYPFDFRS